MVHIPFFGVDVPEPRVLEIVPDVIVTGLRVCSRTLDALTDAVYPLGPEQRQAVCALEAQSVPREFHRVIQRQLEGKIKNDEQMSSECEDASYDYYRRLLRSSAAGASDEASDEFMSTQLFGVPMDPSATVKAQYAAEHPDMQLPTEDALLDLAQQVATPECDSQWVQDRGAEMLQHVRGWQADHATRLAALSEQEQALQQLRQSAKTSMAQARRTTLNAGLGVGLALLAFRGIGIGTSRLLKAIRKARRKAAAGRPTGPVARQTRGSGSGTPQPQPSSATRQSRSQSGSGAPSARQQPAAPAAAAAASTAADQQRTAQQKQSASNSQQQQKQESATSTPARRNRPATRTR